MARSTFKTLFYINRSKLKKNGKCPIMGRITIDGQQVQYSMGLDINPNNWDAKHGRCKGDIDEMKNINRILTEKEGQIQTKYNELVWQKGYVSAELLKNCLTEDSLKTGNVCHIPLLPEASAIIERYKGIHTRAFRHEPPKGYLLPIPGCDTVNIHLKKIARLCGIQKTLTYHMARHTFASQMTLSEGVSIESVSKMLGHSQIKTTQVYAETSPERVFLDIEKILPQLTHYQLTN
ncbi:site-specific integrase [Prevotella rectalis]|uniref:site-specific integrase n=1 Tax=Prevotella rectalis TaxID=2219999 RepID=UPI00102FD683|nr:site-specific integrase [Prevotella brunnea]